jgi:hypothetical protein
MEIMAISTRATGRANAARPVELFSPPIDSPLAPGSAIATCGGGVRKNGAAERSVAVLKAAFAAPASWP